MSDERIPDDIMREAGYVTVQVFTETNVTDDEGNAVYSATKAQKLIARAILAERNRVHKQLKGEG